MNYSMREIAAVCGGEFSGADVTARSVIADSRRSIGSDEAPLFVAIRGRNHDGHDFIDDLYRRGVRAFLVERELDAAQYPGAGFVRVPKSLAGLQALAAHYRASFRGTVVGITGSSGKTTVKEWIAQTMPATFKLFRSPRSYNSQLGAALSLLMIEGDERIALIEAGISQPGEMARLERMIAPDVTLFTSLGDAHQEHFASLEEKCAEKLLLGLHARRILYHGAYEPMASMLREVYADGRELTDAAPYAGGGFADGASERNSQLVEAFWQMMGQPKPDFGRLQPVAMRLEVKEGINGSLLIDDAYNSDMNSLAIALDYLHNVAAGRPTTLILSDILQSGMTDDELYVRVAAMVAAAGVGKVIGIGPHLSAQADRFTGDKAFYLSTDDYLRRIDRADIAGRAVLLKGNRDSRFERLEHALSRRSHTTVLEVDLDAMISNLNYFRARMRPGVRLVAMVKASSYGAGDFEVAQMLQHQGVDYLAVAFADEGVLLRERGISMPIVVLNADADSFGVMVANRLEPEIYNLHSLAEFADAVDRYGERNYPIHIKLDTGMHRLGFMEEELPALLEALGRRRRSLRTATVFAHLCTSDDPSQDDFTRLQIARFDRMSSRLKEALPYDVLRHTANSAAIERFPEAQYDMCRLGLGLYGFGFEHNEALHPVSTLRTRIVQIKRLAPPETVGYGRAGVLTRPTVTATVPIGYADGLDRHLGCGAWSMLVKGRPAPIVGRICMDSCMLDITDIEGVAEGDEALVFSPAARNTPEAMAAVLGTIPYEIMTSVSGRVKRIYLKE